MWGVMGNKEYTFPVLMDDSLLKIINFPAPIMRMVTRVAF